MPANTTPITPLTPNNGMVAFPATATANVKSDGVGTVGTDMFKAFTAGAFGSWVTKVRLSPYASAAATATTATVARIYLSTVTSGATTAADTHLIAEVTLTSFSADSTTTAVQPVEVLIGFAIPTGTFIHVSMHAAPAASTGFQIVTVGADY